MFAIRRQALPVLFRSSTASLNRPFISRVILRNFTDKMSASIVYTDKAAQRMFLLYRGYIKHITNMPVK